MANLEWDTKALKDLKKIDGPIRKRILEKLDWYSRNFDSIVPEPLSGEFEGAYKFRIGDWRAVYIIENDSLIILFIGHRREIYKIKP